MFLAAFTLSIPSEGYFVPRPLEEFVSEREAQATSPSSVLLVPEIAGLWDHEDPDAVLAAVTQAAEDERTPAWATSYARWMQASLLLRLGRVDEARAIYQEMGFIQQWWVIGPFDNDNEAGFDQELPIEASFDDLLDLEANHEGRLREVAWREYPTPGHPDGAVSLGLIMEPAENTCAYLATVVESRRQARAALRLGADGAVRVWFNGVEVYEDDGDRSAVPDRAAAAVQLQAGRNRIVVESCTTAGPWDLFIRLTQPDGSPLTGIEVTADRSAVQAAPRRTRGATFDVPSLWSYFWEQVGGEPVEDSDEDDAEDDDDSAVSAEDGAEEESAIPASAQAELARFLVLFGGDDPSEHRARDAAEAAVDGDPTVDNLRLFARLHPDRNRRLEALRRALAAAPRRVDVLMSLAGEISSGPHLEDAVEYFDDAEQIDPENLYVDLARLDLLAAFGMSMTALGRARPLLERGERAHVVSVVRSIAHSVGMDTLEEEMARRYFQTHQNAGSLRMDLARRHTDRGELQQAADVLREGLAYSPLSIALRNQLAMVFEARGEIDEALEQRREAIAIRPHDGRLLEGLAQFFDRNDRAEEAQVAARRSLELRPENPWLRQWLSVASREERFEEPYIEESETFLARRGRGGGHDLRTLLDLEVRKVHQSGQSDEFRQLVYEAVTLQGARNLAHYQIAYTPHRQRLRIERARVFRPDGSTREAVGRSTRDLYDPSIRMYYDLRATTISFGDLQPGDVVEIRYRISDVGESNELGDYFGEMMLFQTTNPRDRVAYVLLVPRDREFVFNETEMEGLDHRVREQEGVVEHIFEASGVEPVSVESGMPPLAEIAPYLLVSTFRSWDDLGRWYWNLVRDQLELDAGQRARAEELVQGQTTDLAKVRAIHRHVVQSVRYVALEFGVHRFKPYRVSDIERRGFGDCKDQASLMVAMLAHVGVEGELALIRTRRLGTIETTPPSLEVFNHAIVYIPSLDLYIDPTAERVAVGDLPSGDQGVMSLRVSEQGVTLTTTPLIASDRQTRGLEVTLRLDAGGTAQGRLVMETTGWLAGMTRAALDDPANRENYLERLLSRYMRGARVSNVTTSDLTELDSDTEATMDIEVPDFARQEGAELSFAVSVAPPLSSVVSLPTREQDLMFGPPMGWIESIDVQVPQGMQPTALPDPVEIESPMATFRLSVTHRRGGPIQLRSTLLWQAERVTPEQYGQLRDFVEQVTAARTARVRLVSQ